MMIRNVLLLLIIAGMPIAVALFIFLVRYQRKERSAPVATVMVQVLALLIAVASLFAMTSLSGIWQGAFAPTLMPPATLSPTQMLLATTTLIPPPGTPTVTAILSPTTMPVFKYTPPPTRTSPPTATWTPLLAPTPSPTSTPVVGRIAFVSTRDGNSEIYVMNPDGSDQKRLTNNVFDDLAPAWSPDRKKIAFVSGRDGNYEIYVMNADGSNQVRLTSDPASDWYPTWSPDGKMIAFNSNRGGAPYEIFVIEADGIGEPIQLTHNTFGDWGPSWSPDGTKIVFATDRHRPSKEDRGSEIYVMQLNPDWSVVETWLTKELPRSTKKWYPKWSPDGTEIAFSSDAEGDWDIYVMSADGTNVRNLTAMPNVYSSDWYPGWSLDGRDMVFVSDRDGGNYEIYKMTKDGINQIRLTTDPAGYLDQQPAWFR